MKILPMLWLIFQEFRARRHRALVLARIRQREAYLAFQELIPPEVKAREQHTPCCGPIPIHRKQKAFLMI